MFSTAWHRSPTKTFIDPYLRQYPNLFNFYSTLKKEVFNLSGFFACHAISSTFVNRYFVVVEIYIYNVENIPVKQRV